MASVKSTMVTKAPPHIICLMGPTASGKTEIAMQLAESSNCEIISVDSAQVYRGMDIGTAKPGAEELERAPHHLINIIDPIDSYSAASFMTDAQELIKDIASRNKTALLVGGTFLYFRALLQGLAALPEADAQVRSQLQAATNEFGMAVMHDRLRSVDPESANKIHPNDTQRVQRALEVYQIAGLPMSQLIKAQQNQPLPFTVSKFALYPAVRSQLHEQIKTRFYKMVSLGLVEEVEALNQKWNLDVTLPSMRSVGYRQVLKFLHGQYSKTEMTERAIIATRQLAKRQYTWLRGELQSGKQSNLVSFDPQKQSAKSIADTILRTATQTKS